MVAAGRAERPGGPHCGVAVSVSSPTIRHAHAYCCRSTTRHSRGDRSGCSPATATAPCVGRKRRRSPSLQRGTSGGGGPRERRRRRRRKWWSRGVQRIDRVTLPALITSRRASPASLRMETVHQGRWGFVTVNPVGDSARSFTGPPAGSISHLLPGLFSPSIALRSPSLSTADHAGEATELGILQRRTRTFSISGRGRRSETKTEAPSSPPLTHVRCGESLKGSLSARRGRAAFPATVSPLPLALSGRWGRRRAKINLSSAAASKGTFASSASAARASPTLQASARGRRTE